MKTSVYTTVSANSFELGNIPSSSHSSEGYGHSFGYVRYKDGQFLMYIKQKVTRDTDRIAESFAALVANLTELPCDSDGNPVMTTHWLSNEESGTAAEFIFTLYILCKEEPSHKIELKTGKLISILDDPNGNSYVSHTSIGFIIHDLNP